MTYLLLIAAFSAIGSEQIIDDFNFKNAAAARAVWDAKGCPPVDVIPDGRRTVLKLEAPFASSPQINRASIDRKVTLDLSQVSVFLIDVFVGNPKHVGELRLYFRSGKGWFVAKTFLEKKGWQTVRLTKPLFGREDNPAGWNKIDGIRISIWRPSSSECYNTSVRFRRLAFDPSMDIAVIQPVEIENKQDSQYWREHSAVQKTLLWLKELGLEADTINVDAIAETKLERFRVIIIPYTPALDSRSVEHLKKFVSNNGKLLLVDQSSDTLKVALDVNKPQTDSSIGKNLIKLDLSNKDSSGKEQDEQIFKFASSLGTLLPTLWETIVRHQLDQATSIGHCNTGQELAAFLQKSSPDAEQVLDQAREQIRQARKLLANKSFAESFQTAQAVRQMLAQTYMRSSKSPAREGRAVWSHSCFGAYPGDWPRSMKLLSQNGFNMVICNALWGGLAQYPSDILPRDVKLQYFGDQLQKCCEAAKTFNIEVHVWKANYNLVSAPKDFLEKMQKEGRTALSDKGVPLNWLCPSHPDNQKLEIAAMLEVVSRYPIDGLHLDYIRYPSAEYCYCDGCRKRFEAQSGSPVSQWPSECRSGKRKEEYNQWRIRQISAVVAEISREARKIKPNLKISAAVYPDYPSCKNTVAQDWIEWIKSGYLDFVCPMDYTPNNDLFASHVKNQLKLINGRVPLYPGIGATASGMSLSAEQVIGQVNLARMLGAGGFTIFNFEPKTAETIIPAFSLGAGTTPAIPPHRNPDQPSK